MQIASLEEIERILLRLPEIVDRLDSKDPRFSDLVKSWLQDLERAFAENRLFQTAEVAALRAMVISAERGVICPGMEVSGPKTPRKVREAVAADSLKRAEGIAADAIRGDSARIAEGERLARQLVAIAEQKGIIKRFSAEEDHTTMLTGIWSEISLDPDLMAGATALKGLVGFRDALILVDRALPL